MQPDREYQKKTKNWYRRWWAIILWLVIFFGGVLVSAFGFYVWDLSQKINNGEFPANGVKLEETKKYNAEGINNYWIGATEPKITIVEFADFNCAHCKNSFSIIRELTAKYPNQIKLIFRDYPAIAATSQDLAMSARCAGEQGKFWQMHDKLFLNQGKLDPTSKTVIATLAQSAGVDLDKFLTCMDEQKYLNNIKKDVADAESYGVTGTPTWFINGYKISGEIPRATFLQIVNEFLN